MFKGRELADGRDYELIVEGTKINLELLNLHLKPGTMVLCDIYTNERLIVVDGKTSTVQAMRNSMVRVDENRRICLDTDDWEEL